MAETLRSIQKLDEQKIARIADRLRPLLKRADDAHWEIADLLLEEFPIRGERAVGKHDQWTRLYLEKIAYVLEVDWQTLRIWRYVAASWPKEDRWPNATFSKHRRLMRHGNRAELVRLPWSEINKQVAPDSVQASASIRDRTPLANIGKVAWTAIEILQDESVAPEKRIAMVLAMLRKFFDEAAA